jgi:HAD superfamily hydrolase (TIGR01509 family)
LYLSLGMSSTAKRPSQQTSPRGASGDRRIILTAGPVPRCGRTGHMHISFGIKGILFDFDGTLTRPGLLNFPAIKRALGCPADQPILEFIETRPMEMRPRLMSILDEWEIEAARGSIPNLGAERCLQTLKREGLLLGILTRNSLQSVKEALMAFNGIGIDDFRTVITREVSRPKPHPEGVYQAANQMGVHTSEILMVGDFRFDILAGMAAGAGTVLLTNGLDSRLAPTDPQPDYVIRSLMQLPALLGLEEEDLSRKNDASGCETVYVE